MEFIFGVIVGVAVSAGLRWLYARYLKIDWDKTDAQP